MALLINANNFKHKNSFLCKENGDGSFSPIDSILLVVNAAMQSQKSTKVPTGTETREDENGNIILTAQGNEKHFFIYKDMVEVWCEILVFDSDGTTQLKENSLNVEGIPFAYSLMFDPKDASIVSDPNDLDVKHKLLEENLIEILTTRHPDWEGKISLIPNPNPIS